MRKTPSKEIVELLDKWKTFERKLRTIGSVFNFIFFTRTYFIWNILFIPMNNPK